MFDNTRDLMKGGGMRSRGKLLTLVIALFVASVVPANAVTYTVAGGTLDPGPVGGESILVSFDVAIPEGYGLSGDYGMASGSVSGRYTAPAGDTSLFLYTSSQPVTLRTLDLTSVSFYWGSIEADNAVDIFGIDNVPLMTITGAEIVPANGTRDQPDANQRLFITTEGSELITKLRFRTTSSVMEIDDVAGTVFTDSIESPVPEPASWILMLGGFGMVGLITRARRLPDAALLSPKGTP